MYSEDTAYYRDSLDYTIASLATGDEVLELPHVSTQPPIGTPPRNKPHSDPHLLPKLVATARNGQLPLIIPLFCTPDIGIAMSIALAFRLVKCYHLGGKVVVYLWDHTRPSSHAGDSGSFFSETRHDRAAANIFAQYKELLDMLCILSGVPYKFSDTAFNEGSHNSLGRMRSLGISFTFSSGSMSLKAACPRAGCPLIGEFHHARNLVDGDHRLEYVCPTHGRFLQSQALSDHPGLEFRLPLFSLAMGRIYEEIETGLIQIDACGYNSRNQFLSNDMQRNVVVVCRPLTMDLRKSSNSRGCLLQPGVLNMNAVRALESTGMNLILPYQTWRTFFPVGLGRLLWEINSWVKGPQHAALDSGCPTASWRGAVPSLDLYKTYSLQQFYRLVPEEELKDFHVAFYWQSAGI